jgi:hypothetical protein
MDREREVMAERDAGVGYQVVHREVRGYEIGNFAKATTLKAMWLSLSTMLAPLITAIFMLCLWGHKVVVLSYYMMFVFVVFTAYYNTTTGRLFERMKKKFFEIKIFGMYDKEEEEVAYAGMFVSLQGTVMKYSEVTPLVTILLWITLTSRVAGPLISETGWLKEYLYEADA